jgi:hypothetical protein
VTETVFRQSELIERKSGKSPVEAFSTLACQLHPASSSKTDSGVVIAVGPPATISANRDSHRRSDSDCSPTVADTR